MFRPIAAGRIRLAHTRALSDSRCIIPPFGKSLSAIYSISNIGATLMKKASIAVVFFVLIFGLGSAKAEIVSYSAPPQVYVGQSLNAYVVYLANDPALCNAESCPEGWAAPVYAGDFGSFTCTPSCPSSECF